MQKSSDGLKISVMLIMGKNECLADIYHFSSFLIAGSHNCASFKHPRFLLITGRCCVACGSSSSISIPGHQLKIPLISIPLNGGGRDIGCGSDKTASD
jgi:hypothetical protein